MRGMPTFHPRQETKYEFQKRMDEWMKTVPSYDDNDPDYARPILLANPAEGHQRLSASPIKQWEYLMEELNLEIASRTKPEPEMDTPPAQPEMALEITPPAPRDRPLDWLKPK
eukprot:12468823-Prorocentrum_lima.AAC.1